MFYHKYTKIKHNKTTLQNSTGTTLNINDASEYQYPVSLKCLFWKLFSVQYLSVKKQFGCDKLKVDFVFMKKGGNNQKGYFSNCILFLRISETLTVTVMFPFYFLYMPQTSDFVSQITCWRL